MYLLIIVFFLLSLGITIWIIPLVDKLGLTFNITDKPDNRKRHKQEKTRLGGLGILIGIYLPLFLILIFPTYFNSIFSDYRLITITIIGTLLFFLIGLSDDIFDLNPFLRLLFQAVISYLLFSAGTRIEAIGFGPFNSIYYTLYIPKIVSLLLIFLWISGITNSINWLDGIDGLAAGISLMISIGILTILVLSERWDFAIIAASLCGAIFGFLKYNLYPAKVHMGDGGSYLLGSMLSMLSLLVVKIKTVSNGIAMDSYSDSNILPIFILFFLFIIPISDMSIVIFSRIINGYSPFYPDRRHLHHRMIDAGYSQTCIVILICSITQLFVTLSIYLLNFDLNFNVFLISILFMICGLIYTLNHKKIIGN